MARDRLIETTRDYIPDENGNKVLTTINVYYDKSRDSFYTKCPEHLMTQATGFSKQQVGKGEVTVERTDGIIWEDRPQKVLDELLHRAYLYMKAVQKKRKVIAYRIQTEKEMPFEEGEGFLIEWKVGWELVIGDRVQFLRGEPPDNPNEFLCTQTWLMEGDNVKHIEWTEEREEFFHGLSNAINNLKMKCKMFLEDPDKLSKLIANKGNLLLSDGSPRRRLNLE